MSNWSLTEQVLLGIFAAMWLYQVYFYLRFILAAVRRTRSNDHGSADRKKYQMSNDKCQTSNDKCQISTVNYQLPGVSVIVCARNEEKNLRDYLQALLTQDYPEYEVIVVNDGSVDNTRTFLEYWQKRYKNLRLTFVPVGAKVASTKKLAITLGAKAAQYDYLLLTDADCRPESTHWISEMMRGFDQSPRLCLSKEITNNQSQITNHKSQITNNNSQIDIVLGFGAYFAKPGLLNRMIQFDTLLNGLHYLGRAAAGCPYMGVGRNLAYRKQMFFAHGGFSGLMNNKAGDDDLFVNREATATNTAVICSRDSLTWSAPKTTWRDWLHQKRRHLSVAPKYKLSTKLRLALEPTTRGLLYATLIALIVVNYKMSTFNCQLSTINCQLSTAIALAAMLLRWIGQCILLNIPAHRWGTTKTILLIPVWEIILPLITLITMLIEPLRPKPKRW